MKDGGGGAMGGGVTLISNSSSSQVFNVNDRLPGTNEAVTEEDLRLDQIRLTEVQDDGGSEEQKEH